MPSNAANKNVNTRDRLHAYMPFFCIHISKQSCLQCVCVCVRVFWEWIYVRLRIIIASSS